MVAGTKVRDPLLPPKRGSFHMIGPHHLVVSNVTQSGKARKHFAIACPGTFPGLGIRSTSPQKSNVYRHVL